jgi:general secretion pathway protein A
MGVQNVFSSELMSEIHYRSQGIPRIINGVCDNLLLTAFASESRVATMEFLEEVTTDLRLEWPGQRPYRPRSDSSDAASRHEPQYTTRVK